LLAWDGYDGRAAATNKAYTRTGDIMIGLHDIEQVAERLAEATHAERVILFGSHARDDADEESDVDLLIVAPSTLPHHKRTPPLYRMFQPYPFPMDLLVYTPQEVAQEQASGQSLIGRILREGRTVYERSSSPCSRVGRESR
jgi:hypothetical protein